MGARQLQCKMRKANWKGSSTSGLTLRGVAQGRAVMEAERRWGCTNNRCETLRWPWEAYMCCQQRLACSH